MISQEIFKIKVSELHLWTENPRDPVDVNSSDYDIIKRAITGDTNKKWKLQSLVNLMGDYYDFSELPTVVVVDGKNVVYDGNRRIAVLKYLQNEDLYRQLNGGLFFNEESENLRNLHEIPCNVCDKETALKNVLRKHIGTGSWNELEKDYFLYNHLNKPKSLFIYLEEQTSIISNNPKLSQRFVKEEVLTNDNLAEIGLKYEAEKGFFTNYDPITLNKILNAITTLVDKEVISTRNNRKQLKAPLISENPELKDLIKPYNPKEIGGIIENQNKSPMNTVVKPVLQRRTKITTPNSILFGKTLALKQGKVNDLYRAIYRIHESNLQNDTILPVLGMSMRLITEVGARLYFEENEPEHAKKDQLYSDFLKKAKKEMQSKKELLNFLSITQEWLTDRENLDGILAKYAHGNIPVNRESIIQHSIIIGEILEFYFKRE